MLVDDALRLDGGAADSVRQAFAPVDAVQSGITTLSVVLLLFSGLSFTRGMQRLYEGAFSLPTRGMRNTKWGIVWLLVVTLLSRLRPIVLGGLNGALETIVSLFISGLLWLVTPYLLLGRRLHWLRLLPGRRAVGDRHDRRRHLVGPVDAAHDRVLGRPVRRHRDRVRAAHLVRRGRGRAGGRGDRRRDDLRPPRRVASAGPDLTEDRAATRRAAAQRPDAGG